MYDAKFFNSRTKSPTKRALVKIIVLHRPLQSIQQFHLFQHLFYNSPGMQRLYAANLLVSLWGLENFPSVQMLIAVLFLKADS